MAEKTRDGSAGKATQLPVARVKTIMKSSPDQPLFSQDSVFLITKATELFINYLTVAAHKKESDSKQLTYKGLYIVPPKVLVKDFLESLKKKSRMSPVDVGSSSSESE
ncbi:chromatin accessibility complex protein 1-like isoform X2 [Stylophora pistillata]|uniref:chromatin accessibility complex protein 1-like isoform X2 n=1 Tax=Stylophora pistillata TaxID=50429 RepID=UPI000C03CCB9|nr:chromatin accessibility complex protein 1-like isoform X2 [Stylophora pistillata]